MTAEVRRRSYASDNAFQDLKPTTQEELNEMYESDNAFQDLKPTYHASSRSSSIGSDNAFQDLKHMSYRDRASFRMVR